MTTTALPTVDLNGKQLSLESIRAIAEEGATVRVTNEARGRVAAARRLVDEKFGIGDAIYGVTTGFGRLANVPVEPKDAAQSAD